MWILAIWFALAAAAPEPFPLGTIVDSVSCLDHPEQQYALFLPSGYAPDRVWPIVIMLDPAARGRAPLERFAPAAEALGYILVGSHNSQNGPLQPSIDALTILWGEISQRFAIDPARVYLGGFSGGARMASHLAQSANVAGVIASGAGLLNGEAKRFPFVLVATAGRQDMNYLEVRVLAENLTKRGSRATLLEFDGDHDWPPAETARRALEWLKLEAVRAGLEPRDTDFLASYRDSAMGRALALEEGLQGYDALLEYQALIRDLDGLQGVGPAKLRRDFLLQDPQVQEEQRRQATTDKVEAAEIKALLKQFLSDRPSKGDEWWQGKLTSFRELAKRNLRNAEDLSQRLLHFVLSYGAEKAWFASEDRNYPLALYFTRVALLARPESAELQYRRARLLALTGEAEASLAALGKAIDLGWRDASRLAVDEAFAELRQRPEFRQLIARLR